MQVATAGRARRLARAIPVPLTIALAVVGVAELAFFWDYLGREGWIGLDYMWFVGVAQRWLDTGVYYLPHQTAGPYHVVTMIDVLYPPNALFLFVPFIWLPWWLWWAIPVALFTYCVVRLRPARWAWPLIMLGVVWPPTVSQFLYGNTNMWFAAAIAAGTVWAWPSVFVLMKPNILPFAFIGVRHRSWWVALVIFGTASLIVFRGMWIDYLNAMLYSDLDATYSLRALPLFLAPVFAWIARDRRRETMPATTSAPPS